MVENDTPIKPCGKIAAMTGDVASGKNVSVFGVGKTAKWALFTLLGKAVLIETDYVAAREAYEFVHSFADDVVFLPAESDSVGFALERMGDNDYARSEAIARIAAGAKRVVTFTEAAMQLYPDREEVRKRTFTLRAGDACDPQSLAGKLLAAGYRRVSQLDGKAQFAIRGDIVDISPVGMDEYCRVVIDFDVIGSLRRIDPEEQVTSGKADEVFIAPFGCCYYTKEEGKRAMKQVRKEAEKLSPDAYAHFTALLGELDIRTESCRPDVPFLKPYLGCVPFAEFMSGYHAVIGNAKMCWDGAELLRKEHSGRLDVLMRSGDALPGSERQIAHISEAFAFSRGMTVFHTGMSANRFCKTDVVIELSDSPVPDYSRDYELLAGDIKNWLRGGYEVSLFAGNQDTAAKLYDFLMGKGIPFGSADKSGGRVEIIDGILPSGFILHECRQVFIGTGSLIPKYKPTRSQRRRDVMPLPGVGEYVVHDTHGVGKCLAIERLDFSGAAHDYVIIGYAEGDKLYLPVENLDSLSRYSYAGAEPRLSRLGGGQFARLKEKVKKSIKEMSVDLVRLYGKRAAGKGYVYVPEPALMDDFISAFPHMDTADQTAATEDILSDLAKGKIMDRLLCGDVGFGKTEVALRAAYRVIAEGKQVAFLCPTTLLALQHYKTAVKRMESFGVRVAMLSRLSGESGAKETLKALEEGKIDMVCGTHKLLGKGVKFADLGLLILDEEQRFGVGQKEHLKEMREKVNVLTLSATPIPRTLHMSLTGIRDISMLQTPPFERLPVQTFVSEYSDGLLADALMREYSRGGQSFVVFNRVGGIDSFAEKTSRLVPDLKIGVVHGQMSAENAEKVISDFADGKTDVLIATTIIENGIDIPRANTMVVINSDTFGLSQMYQMRGRIGRSNRLASAYFTYDSNKQVTDIAMQRLDAIMQCKELGSGFMLAMRDLELRGAGNVLGREQHGHMEAVGYDTYMELLREVIAESSGGEIKERKEVVVKTEYNAYIPEKYVTDEEWRVRQYGNISRIDSMNDLRRMINTMRDIYGAPPDEVVNLLTVALVKNRAADAGADEVTLMRGRSSVVFRLAKDVPSDFVEKAERAGGVMKMDEKLSIIFPTGNRLVKFLCEYGISAA